MKAIEILNKLNKAEHWEDYYPSKLQCNEAIAEFESYITNYQLIKRRLDKSSETLRKFHIDKKRCCGNCKNFEEANDKCQRGVMLNWRHEIDDMKFFCNRWESK